MECIAVWRPRAQVVQVLQLQRTPYKYPFVRFVAPRRAPDSNDWCIVPCPVVADEPSFHVFFPQAFMVVPIALETAPHSTLQELNTNDPTVLHGRDRTFRLYAHITSPVTSLPSITVAPPLRIVRGADAVPLLLDTLYRV